MLPQFQARTGRPLLGAPMSAPRLSRFAYRATARAHVVARAARDLLLIIVTNHDDYHEFPCLDPFHARAAVKEFCTRNRLKLESYRVPKEARLINCDAASARDLSADNRARRAHEELELNRYLSCQLDDHNGDVVYHRKQRRLRSTLWQPRKPRTPDAIRRATLRARIAAVREKIEQRSAPAARSA